uniref:Uncharacterized protein n=1 Tax=Arundo donax TaxID=35708 RepID=A0A0A9BG54_ARUDO
MAGALIDIVQLELSPTRSRIVPSTIFKRTYGSTIEANAAARGSELKDDSEVCIVKFSSCVMKEPSSTQAPLAYTCMTRCLPNKLPAAIVLT